MISAPYPQTDCESVREYNAKHVGKAWRIVAMTWQGDIYCTRETCAGTWPTYEGDLVESPYPVFSSDEYEEMACGNCGGDLG